MAAGVPGSILPGQRIDFRPLPIAMEKKEIIFRAIPSSAEKIPAIGMGTWLTFDAGNSEDKKKELKEVLRIFHENGGKLIDSSPMYGSSEKVAGDLVKDLKIRISFSLQRKYGQPVKRMEFDKCSTHLKRCNLENGSNAGSQPGRCQTL